MKRLLLILLLTILLFSESISKAEINTIYGVAGDKQFPPYEYVDEDGIFKGFNVDMLKAIGLVTGMEFEFIPMKWEDAYYSIDKGQADIIQGMKESEYRKEKFLFSESLLVNSQSIFVLNGSTDIRGIYDLSNKKVAVNIEDINYKDISKIEDIDIIQYESFSKALDALLDGEAEVLIGNTLTINYLCKENNSIDRIQIVGNSLNESRYSIAVGKNNEELLNKINAGILELQRNGMYDSLYRKWFGTPIRNARNENEGLFKIVLLICGALIIGIFAIQKLNMSLNKIIVQKTEEHKILIDELRHYDKLQFMDKIISSIAHEIRNPMTSIKLYVSQMDQKLENKEFMTAASKDISEEVERIEGLITEFVEYSSPRKANVEDLNLKEELYNALSFVKLQIRKAAITMEVDESTYIKFDKSHFRQVILNIFLNSADAIKDSTNPKIEIKSRETMQEVLLTIRDNGEGMKVENLKYIFEPFYTTKDYGNGVGMFIVKQIIQENKGEIAVNSEGKGLGMIITIKMKKGEAIEE